MHKILLMDDDPIFMMNFKEILELHNYNVVIESPNNNIVKLVEKNKFDLIILDYLMGELNGGDLCLLLKENASTAHIPVIILTAFEKVFKALGNNSCNLTMSKMDNTNILIAQIESLLK